MVKFRYLLPVMLALALLAPSVQSATLTVCGSGCDNTTVQAAVDAASAGDTVQVGDGTYTENLLVAVANLTVESVNGSASTAIHCLSGVCINLDTGSDGFVLGGASGNGFNVVSNATGTTFLVQLTHRYNDVVLSYNQFDSRGGATMGVSVGNEGVDGLDVSNNVFYADTGDGSIWVPLGNDVIVADNMFTADATSSGYAFEASGLTDAEIAGNTIVDYGQGVVVFHGEGVSALSIHDNNLTGCNTSFRFGEYKATAGADGDLEDVELYANTVTHDVNALRIHPDGVHVLVSDIYVYANSFSGSSSYAVRNQHSTGVLDVTGNYWGTPRVNLTTLVSGNVLVFPPCVVADCSTLLSMTFDGSMSTNFSTVSNWSAVPLVLGNSQGLVNWSSVVDLSASNMRFDDYVPMGYRSIRVDSSNMPELDVPAVLTFRNTGFTSAGNFEVQKDGVVCSATDCSGVEVVNGDDVMVTVVGFSTYTLVGGVLYENLNAAGSGLGSFLTYITEPVVNVVLALGLVGGILAILYALAGVITRAVGGASKQSGLGG